MVLMVLTFISFLTVPISKSSVLYSSLGENVVRIYRSEILWSFTSNSSIQGDPMYLRLEILQSGIQYQAVYQHEKNIAYSPMSIDIGVVFVGSDRIVYSFSAKLPNASLDIDSNIKIDKNSLTVQWLHIKTIIYGHTYSTTETKVLQLGKYIKNIAERFYKDMLEDSVDAFVLKILSHQGLIENIYVYDLTLDMPKYVEYLTLRQNTSDKTCREVLGNLTAIPIYVEVKAFESYSSSSHNITVKISGINPFKSLDTLLCFTPLIDFLDDIFKSIDLGICYKDIATLYGIDLDRKLEYFYYRYIISLNHYEELFKRIVSKYSEYLQRPYITFEYYDYADKSNISVRIGTLIPKETNLEIALDMLMDVTEIISRQLGDVYTDVQLQYLLSKAQIITDTKANPSIGVNDANSIIMITYMLIAFQTSAILYIIIRFFRAKK